jgi:hypothetical protein
MHVRLCCMAIGMLLSSTVGAQTAPADWGMDVGALAGGGSELLQHAPDAQLDELFQALHSVAHDDHDAQALCALFAPDADRSLQGFNTLAARLGPANRSDLATALADVLVVAMQSPPQADHHAQAQQSLKAAGVTAALLHDGFVAGLQSSAAPPARCQSLRWLLDAMQTRAATERAAMTRLLLDQGLGLISASG